jgi:hypothetical protein
MKLPTMLCKPYVDEEIHEALFQMGPTKRLAWMVSQHCFISAVGIFLNLIFALQLGAFYKVTLFQMVFVIQLLP